MISKFKLWQLRAPDAAASFTYATMDRAITRMAVARTVARILASHETRQEKARQIRIVRRVSGLFSRMKGR